MSATLKDVAAHAGVSHKTVSNVIHGKHARVSVETEARVRASITALNYRPNIAARYLRKSPLGIFALVIPDLSNPFFSLLGNAVVEVAAAYNYTVLIDHTHGNHANELRAIKGQLLHMVDGMILNPLFLNAEDIVSQEFELPVVLLGQRLFGSPFDQVRSNDIEAAQLATTHLLELGRRRIALIGVSDDEMDAMPNLRLQGYKQALAKYNVPLDERLIAHIPPRSFQRIDGARAMQHLLTLDPRPDGLFCFNDLLALGAIKVLSETGYRVPEDIAVVGFDNIEDGKYCSPSLTTINVDVQEEARIAVSLLIERIRNKHDKPPMFIELPFSLVARQSTLGRSYTFTLPPE